MTRAIPAGATKHKETRPFTTETVPAALTKNHDTKPGVWGLICVDKGTLDLSYGDPVTETIRIEAGNSGVVAPQEVHKVTLHPDTEFHIEFYSVESKN